MDRIRINTHVSVKQCSLCQGDTKYYCFQCQKGICNQCKKIHVIDLRTKDHQVTSYLERNKYPQKKLTCRTRPGEPGNYESRGVLEYESSVECSSHDEIERRRYYPKIHKLRSEVLYYRLALFEGLRDDVQSGYRKVIIKGQLTADIRGQELKAMICDVLTGDLEDRSIIQRTRMSRYIKKLEKFEQKFLELVASPVKLLRFLKQIHNPQTDDKKSLKIVCKIVKGMHMRQTETRSARKEHLLRMMFSPVLQTCLIVADVVACSHISCVTLDRVWVSDDNKLVLTDTTTGDSLHSVGDSWHSGSSSGVHAVNDSLELIYIDKDKNINKLSKDLKTTTTFIRNSEFAWSVLSLYCSSSTGDLLVGMFKLNKAAMVVVYSNTGCCTQTIPQEVDENQPLFRRPHYITKNNNGDVVVSDAYLRAVVVTSKEGIHRFSYEGPKSGSELRPRGICTDVMSNILVCDGYTKTVQMIDKEGRFLSYLLTYPSPGPNGLSYDVINHFLCVGQWGTNKVFIYKSDNKNLALNDKEDLCDVLLSSEPSQSQCIPGFNQEEHALFNVRAEVRSALETATWKGENILRAAKSFVPKVGNKPARFYLEAGAALQEDENAASEVETTAILPQNYAHIMAQIAGPNEALEVKIAAMLTKIRAQIAQKVANELARIKAAVEAAEATTILVEAQAAAKDAKEALSKIENLVEEETKYNCYWERKVGEAGASWW